jgi:hypothetical protein
MRCGRLATRKANTRMLLHGKGQKTLSSSQRLVRRCVTVLGLERLGSHFVGFALNAILVVLPLCFVYSIAFRALLDVFVIRVPIGSH